jgi:hypothetical protein
MSTEVTTSQSECDLESAPQIRLDRDRQSLWVDPSMPELECLQTTAIVGVADPATGVTLRRQRRPLYQLTDPPGTVSMRFPIGLGTAGTQTTRAGVQAWKTSSIPGSFPLCAESPDAQSRSPVSPKTTCEARLGFAKAGAQYGSVPRNQSGSETPVILPYHTFGAPKRMGQKRPPLLEPPTLLTKHSRDCHGFVKDSPYHQVSQSC